MDGWYCWDSFSNLCWSDKMKIAILDDDPKQLLVFEDLIYSNTRGVSIDFYDSAYKFSQMDSGQYKMIIVDHRFNDGDDWKEVYKRLKNRPQVIVTMTYNKDYYKKEFPDLYHMLTNEVRGLDNVTAIQKDDQDSLLKMIQIEVLEERFNQNISRIEK